MSRNTWHIQRDGARLTLSRRLPARFDVMASAEFPTMGRGRRARQIRQDLWRLLKGLRGFSPVIQIDATETGLQVSAGGSMLASTPVPKGTEARIQALLESPDHRQRWLAWAQERGQ
jgi:hypothetical protein